MRPRDWVAVILAASVGVCMLVVIALTFGPWTPQPDGAVAAELFAVVAAALGAVSVYLGMTAGADHDHDHDRRDDDVDDDPDAG